MNLIAWILFGVIVGMVGYMLDPHGNEGVLTRNILLGMGGALLGGVVASTLFGFTLESFNFTSFLLAVSGALLLLMASRVMKRA